METPGFENLQLSLAPPLATVRLNRPAKLNALNSTTIAELGAAFEFLRGPVRDASLRAVILTGAGEKAFAAGADIAELATLDAAAGRETSRRGNAVMRAIETFPAPVIAAINGFALGGGLELALSCSIRLAAEHAKLGQPEVKLGLIPGYGGTQRLARLAGRGAALEMILAGEPISASEAHRLGLVNRVVPAAELMAAAEALAQRIAANAPLAVSFCLEAVRQGGDMDIESGLALEAALFGLSCSTSDMKEGTRAFLEKRAARFEGK